MSDPSEHLALRLGGFHPTGGQRVSASATLKPRTVVRLLSGGMAHTLAASQRASQRLLAECRALTSSWRLEPFRHLATSLSGELADAIEESVSLANHDSPMVEMLGWPARSVSLMGITVASGGSHNISHWPMLTARWLIGQDRSEARAGRQGPGNMVLR